MRRLLVICLGLSLWLSPAVAQERLELVALTLDFTSGQKSISLRTDAQGGVFGRIDGRWQQLGRVDSQARFRWGEQSIALDAQGTFLLNEEATPLRLEGEATVCLQDLPVYRVEALTWHELAPVAHAFGVPITQVRFSGPIRGDRLAAFLMAVYLLAPD